jgi:hypothetical protein
MDMEMTLNVNVQIKGHAVGTLGWFHDWLNRSELVIRNTRDGRPGMFLHEKVDQKGSPRQEHEGNTFICKPESLGMEAMYYDSLEINNIRYSCTHICESDLSSAVSFSNFPLTPSCRLAIEKFVEDAVRKFADWYEVQ